MLSTFGFLWASYYAKSHIHLQGHVFSLATCTLRTVSDLPALQVGAPAT